MLDWMLKRKDSRKGLSPNSTLDENWIKDYDVADEEIRKKILEDYDWEWKKFTLTPQED